MKSNSLFKLQSIVAIVLVTASVARADNSCDSTLNLFKQLMGNKDKTTPSVGSVINNCNSSSSSTDVCSAQQSNTNSLAASIQSTQNSLLDRQTSMIDAEKDNSLTIVDLQKQIADDTAKINSASQIYEAKVQKANDELSVASKKAMDNTAAELLKIQQAITETGNKIIQANAALQAASDAISNAQLDQESQCRQTAYQASDKKKAQLDAAYEELKKKAVNIGGADAAGYENRRKAKYAVNIQNEYMNAYKNCMSGATGATGQVQKAVTAYNSAQKLFAATLVQIDAEKADLQKQQALAQQNGQTALAEAAAAARTALSEAQIVYKQDIAAAQNDAAAANSKIGIIGKAYAAKNEAVRRALADAMQMAQRESARYVQSVNNYQACFAKQQSSSKNSSSSQSDPDSQQDDSDPTSSPGVKQTAPAPNARATQGTH